MEATATPNRRIADLPGPTGLPIVGNALQIKHDSFHQQLEGWSATYGNAFRLRMGPRQIVVLADADATAEALRDRPVRFGRSDKLVSIAEEMRFRGVFASNGESWRRQRPMVMAAFDPGHIRQYFPSLVKVTGRFANRWQRAAAAGQAIDLKADLMRYTVDVIAGLAFGIDMNTLESDDDIIQQHLDQIFPTLFKRAISPFSYWRYFQLPSDRRVAAHLEALRVAIDGFIATARARIEADPGLRETPSNLIEAMIVARDKPGSQLTDIEVAGNVFTMLLAGEDTTAHTLAWMIYLLERNPQALERAKNEVRGVLGDDRFPTRLEQMAQLEFVEACAHETMRLKPVAPIMALQTAQDTALSGVDLPAGTMCIFLMRTGSMDERHFKAAQQFDPTRWMAAETEGAADSRSAKRVSMPFGAGPRICPGRYLALLEIKMAIAMLLGGFDIESVSTADGGEAREHFAFTMAPSTLQLRLKVR